MPESQRAISPVTEGREGQGLGHNTHKHEGAEKGTHRYPKTYACAHTHKANTQWKNSEWKQGERGGGEAKSTVRSRESAGLTLKGNEGQSGD